MGMQRVRQNKLRKRGLIYNSNNPQGGRCRIHRALINAVCIDKVLIEEEEDLSLNVKVRRKVKITDSHYREGVSVVGRQKRKGKSIPLI